MNLTYRGVKYSEESPKLTTATTTVENPEIIYRGNTLKAKIQPRFPWLKYIQQLFNKSESQPVRDPITFWYDHKKAFLISCWHLDDRERLERCWNLTLKIEQAKAWQQKPKTQLKYRGVTYYH
ncbi:MAG TPA: DUF4278 domain-containing protein [Xenococcaceae cyanobacterium]